VDYRKLNSVTNQDAYPLPRIDESLDALASSKYFSTLDLLSGYWQVPLSLDAQEKAAFITRDGLWKWKSARPASIAVSLAWRDGGGCMPEGRGRS